MQFTPVGNDNVIAPADGGLERQAAAPRPPPPHAPDPPLTVTQSVPVPVTATALPEPSPRNAFVVDAIEDPLPDPTVNEYGPYTPPPRLVGNVMV